jgi:hypothetical protein
MFMFASDCVIPDRFKGGVTMLTIPLVTFAATIWSGLLHALFFAAHHINGTFSLVG